MKVLRPCHPNAGIAAAYRRRMVRLIDEMHRSVLHWITAAYEANEPAIAQDVLPAKAFRDEMRKLVRRWQRRFDEAAPELADYFATEVSDRSDGALCAILKKAGITVKLQMTQAQRDVLAATVFENVGLIKSIPQQYLMQVEGSVMRSVQAGRDLGTLAKELQDRYKVTKKRAALIARDQNNKVNAVMTRTRQIELKITEAVWKHSHAGKKPRPTHVKMDGKRYDVAEGMYDSKEGRNVFPGELINCRCTSRSVIQGFG